MEPRALLRALLARDGAGLPRSEPAWDALAARAAMLGAEGLLHAAIRGAGDGVVAPRALREQLRRAHAATTAKNLELEAESRAVLAALEAAGVVAAPMKGAALFREGVVRDLGTRPTVDLDLATRPADRAVVLRVLRERGYAPSDAGRSWKHLPPMRRGDLAIEVHEIAWWSGRTREVFGAEQLAVTDPALRLGRLWALQVHHLVLGSPPDAALLVRTLADVAAFVERTRAVPGLAVAAACAAREAGLEREMAACDALVAEARGEARVLALATDAVVMRALVAPLAAEDEVDPRLLVLSHFLRTAHRQPVSVSLATLRTLLEPPRASSADRRAALGRAVRLAARVARTMPRALRDLLARSTRGR